MIPLIFRRIRPAVAVLASGGASFLLPLFSSSLFSFPHRTARCYGGTPSATADPPAASARHCHLQLPTAAQLPPATSWRSEGLHRLPPPGGELAPLTWCFPRTTPQK